MLSRDNINLKLHKSIKKREEMGTISITNENVQSICKQLNIFFE